MSILQKKEVMVIDDDPFILQSIKKQLKEQNLNLKLINNPEEGLVEIDKKHFDLVLCDIKMEPMNGIEVIKKLRINHPDMPVIILSGYVDDQLIEKTKNIGCKKFLIKPVRKKELIDTISNEIC
jgi:YesN/AraC family two-component response regulator